jgi:glycogen synthase
VAGGSERYVQELAKRQVREGHKVTVVATDAASLHALWAAGGQRVDSDVPVEHEGVHILRLSPCYLPWGRVTFPLLRRFSWLLSRLSSGLALRLSVLVPWLPQLPDTLIAQRPEVLFAWNITLEGLTAATADVAAARDLPWVSIPLLHLARRHFYTMPHQLALVAQADQVWTLTEYEREYLVRSGFSPTQVRVHSPGIDLTDVGSASGERFRARYDLSEPIVVTLGSLGYDKGTLHLLQAARRLWQKGHSFDLVLAGTLSPSVRRALEHTPAEHCRYLGWISEAEKVDLLAAARVLALPSRTESFGLVFLESWAHGKPVVGARSGALESVIEHERDGYLVDFGDVRGLAEVLEHLLLDHDHAARLGARGWEKVRTCYTWERQYGRIRSAVGELMAKGGSSEHIHRPG